jgi:nicotinamide riboside kinase
MFLPPDIPNSFEIHHYANFFTKQTIIFCTKHATDKETLVNLLENRINATLMETYKKFVLIHSGQSGTSQN